MECTSKCTLSSALPHSSRIATLKVIRGTPQYVDPVLLLSLVVCSTPHCRPSEKYHLTRAKAVDRRNCYELADFHLARVDLYERSRSKVDMSNVKAPEVITRM